MELDVTLLIGLSTDAFVDDPERSFSDWMRNRKLFQTPNDTPEGKAIKALLSSRTFLDDNELCKQILTVYMEEAFEFVTPIQRTSSSRSQGPTFKAALDQIPKWYDDSSTTDHAKKRQMREAKRDTWFKTEGTFEKLAGTLTTGGKPNGKQLEKLLRRLKALEKQLRERINTTCCAASFARRLAEAKQIIAPGETDGDDPCEPDAITLQYYKKNTGTPHLQVPASGCVQNCKVKRTKAACLAPLLADNKTPLCQWGNISPQIDNLDDDSKAILESHNVCEFNTGVNFTTQWKAAQDGITTARQTVDIAPSFDLACGLEEPFQPAEDRLKVKALGCTSLVGNEGAVLMQLQPRNSKHWQKVVERLSRFTFASGEKPCIDPTMTRTGSKCPTAEELSAQARRDYGGEGNRVDLWAALETRRIQLATEAEAQYLATSFVGAELQAATLIEKRWESIRLYELFLRGGAAAVEGVQKSFQDTNTAQGMLDAYNTLARTGAGATAGTGAVKVDLKAYSAAKGCSVDYPPWWQASDVETSFTQDQASCTLGKPELQMRLSAITKELPSNELALDGMTVRALASLDDAQANALKTLYTQDTYPYTKQADSMLRYSWEDYNQVTNERTSVISGRIDKLRKCLQEETSIEATQKQQSEWKSAHALTCVDDGIKIHLLNEVSQDFDSVDSMTLVFPAVTPALFKQHQQEMTTVEIGLWTTQWGGTKNTQGKVTAVYSKPKSGKKDRSWSIEYQTPETASKPHILLLGNALATLATGGVANSKLRTAAVNDLLAYLGWNNKAGGIQTGSPDTLKGKYGGNLSYTTDKQYDLIIIPSGHVTEKKEKRQVWQLARLAANGTITYPELTEIRLLKEQSEVWHGSWGQFEKKTEGGVTYYARDPHNAADLTYRPHVQPAIKLTIELPKKERGKEMGKEMDPANLQVVPTIVGDWPHLPPNVDVQAIGAIGEDYPIRIKVAANNTVTLNDVLGEAGLLDGGKTGDSKYSRMIHMIPYLGTYNGDDEQPSTIALATNVEKRFGKQVAGEVKTLIQDQTPVRNSKDYGTYSAYDYTCDYGVRNTYYQSIASMDRTLHPEYGSILCGVGLLPDHTTP